MIARCYEWLLKRVSDEVYSQIILLSLCVKAESESYILGYIYSPTSHFRDEETKHFFSVDYHAEESCGRIS